MPTDTQYPKLRAIDPQPISHGNRASILLRDPLRLADKTVVLPQRLAPLLVLCDGTRNVSGLRASLIVRFGLRVGEDVVTQVLAALDEALLLENDRFIEARERARAEYRQAPHRPPSLAGHSYPASAGELRLLLDRYLAAADAHPSSTDSRGLVSPHIDYARGGPVYAAVWKRAADAAREADLVVVLGTDHQGDKRLTLTRQNYGTPFGVLPTAQGIVDALAKAIGHDEAFAGELIHRTEHSIELTTVWLHHVREGKPCEIVPILCGSFGRFVQGEGEPAHDSAINALVDTLAQVTAERRALVVAAADLAHVGPVFGGRPLGVMERAQVQADDDELIERICAGDADGFFETIKREGDRRNVCGVPPIYLALRILSPVQGERVAYERCPADENGTSLVSVCGLALR